MFYSILSYIVAHASIICFVAVLLFLIVMASAEVEFFTLALLPIPKQLTIANENELVLFKQHFSPIWTVRLLCGKKRLFNCYSKSLKVSYGTVSRIDKKIGRVYIKVDNEEFPLTNFLPRSTDVGDTVICFYSENKRRENVFRYAAKA